MFPKRGQNFDGPWVLGLKNYTPPLQDICQLKICCTMVYWTELCPISGTARHMLITTTPNANTLSTPLPHITVPELVPQLTTESQVMSGDIYIYIHVKYYGKVLSTGTRSLFSLKRKLTVPNEDTLEDNIWQKRDSMGFSAMGYIYFAISLTTALQPYVVKTAMSDTIQRDFLQDCDKRENTEDLCLRFWWHCVSIIRSEFWSHIWIWWVWTRWIWTRLWIWTWWLGILKHCE